VIDPSVLRAKIYSNWGAFAALKADGSITAWGGSDTGGTGAPDGNGYTKIVLFHLKDLNKKTKRCLNSYACL
jgi:hypothetical protein